MISIRKRLDQEFRAIRGEHGLLHRKFWMRAIDNWARRLEFEALREIVGEEPEQVD
jgi:hypothetical protein